MIKPILQDSYDPISESDLRQLEDDVGARLPADYRAFLLEHNGGDFPFEVATTSDSSDPRYTTIGYFYGINTGDSSDLLATNRLIDHLPSGFLAIGGDSCGDQICVVGTGRQAGSIWAWDHEEEHSDHWPPRDSHRVADNFTDLYKRLCYDSYQTDVCWEETIPAFMAAERGDSETLLSILNQGFEIEACNGTGATLLNCAAAARQSQIVQLLLERGASVDSRDLTDSTPLLWAARTHSLDSAKLLVAAGADLEATDIDGNTPLLAGVLVDYRVPLFLVSQGANVNARNNEGDSPLDLCSNCDEYLRDHFV